MPEFQIPLHVIVDNGLVFATYDYIAPDFSGSTTDVYTFKSGGAAGTTVATLTITYTSSTKAVIASIAKT